MRRGFVITAVLVLLVLFGLWMGERVSHGWFGGSKTITPPRVLVGRDDREEPLRRDQAELDEAVIRCEFTGPGDPGALVAVGLETVTATDLTLRLDPGEWHVYWLASNGHDYPLGTFELDAGDTHTCQLPPWGQAITGHVRTPDGRPLEGAVVRGCSRTFVETDADGAFALTITRSACEVQAMWRDGILSRYSARVPVSIFDRPTSIELELDDAPVAGMGIAFDVTADGVVVSRVQAGTPAEDAGLLSGDLLTEIDGTSTFGIDDDTFVRLGTGKEGSSVNLVVLREGEEVRVNFRRERIARADTG